MSSLEALHLFNSTNQRKICTKSQHVLTCLLGHVLNSVVLYLSILFKTISMPTCLLGGFMWFMLHSHKKNEHSHMQYDISIIWWLPHSNISFQ